MGGHEFRKQARCIYVAKVTGQPVVRTVNEEASLVAQEKASKGGSGVSERVEVRSFLIPKSMPCPPSLDPARRLGVRDALQHDFSQKKTEENA